jgi:ABC-2 type transport system ATP-binding protein
VNADFAIAASGVRKSFGRQPVLRGIDLHVRRGELIGLVGPNGAGKTTWLRACVGLLQIDGGELAVLGRDPRRDAMAIRQHCSYLPGETSVYLEMTGQQFLAFAQSFYPRHDGQRLAALQQGFQLPLGKRVRSYSAGMKQKLAVLATLMPDVDLYLLDEPDRALDASMRFCLRSVLRSMQQAGKTIVLSSHHLSEVESLADRLEFLVAGALVPQPQLDAARAQLRRRLRLRLLPGTPLPPGSTVLEQEPDGTLVLATEQLPLDVLRTLPAASVLAAELGHVHLEDLYQLLVDGNAPQAAS